MKKWFSLDDDVLWRNDEDYVVIYRYQSGSLSFYIPNQLEIIIFPLLLLKDYDSLLIHTKNIISQDGLESFILKLKRLKIIKEIPSKNNKILRRDLAFCNDISKIDIKRYNADILRFNLPLLVGLNITNLCKFNCKYCYAERKKISELSTKNWLNILDTLKDYNIRLIDIVGGDIFTREDAVKIIRHMIENDFIFSISTKSLITQQTAEELSKTKKMNNITFQISLDSYDPLSVEKLTGIQDAYCLSISSIKNLVDVGFYPRVKAVLTKYNFKHTEGFVENMLKLGVREISFVSASKSYYRDNTKILLNDKEITEVEESINNIRKKYPITIYWQDAKMESFKTIEEWEKRTICSAGRSSLIIMPNGDISICEQMPYRDEYIFGNMLKDSLINVWNSKKLLSFIYPNKDRFAKNSLCYNCDYFYRCNIKGRCFRDALFYYSTPFDAPPYCFKRQNKTNSLTTI